MTKLYGSIKMTMDKTISIIIPCYKYAHYLAECVGSVVNQTYKAKEIIIVNDGSPDNTSEVARELIAKYLESNIILLEKENGGNSAARNVGIKIATSEYIMCLDPDDKLVPAALEEHVKLLTDDMTIAQCALMEFGDRYVINVPTISPTLERILKTNTIFCNAVFPRRAWEEVGGYDENEIITNGFEDWEIWIRMLAAGYHVNVSDFIALRYRVHEGQMTQVTTHPRRQELYEYIFNKHRALYDKYGLLKAGLN